MLIKGPVYDCPNNSGAHCMCIRQPETTGASAHIQCCKCGHTQPDPLRITC